MKNPVILLLLIFMAGTSYGQWTQQNSNTPSNLKSVHFLNDSVGFVVGNNGVFLKTYNRGLNWNLTVINASENLNAVCAINVDTIFVGGDNLYKSTDGGQNWNIISNQYKVFELKFLSPQVGFLKTEWLYICSEYPPISAYEQEYYRTTDGGNTWQLYSQLPTNYYNGEIDIITSDTAYLTGNLIFWESSDCYSIISSRMHKTTDGGMTWQEVYEISYSGSNMDASFLNGWEGYLLYAESGKHLYKIKGGGSEFVYVADITGNSIGSLVFATLYEGYYNNAGKIMKTNSGGILWEEDYNGPTSISILVITKNYEGYAIGNSGLILHKKINPAYEPQSLLNIDNTLLDFPVTNIKENSNLSFALRAAGNADITVDIVSPMNFLIKTENTEEYVSQISGLVMPSLHDTTITVQFTPSDYANYCDTILITSNSTNNPVIKLPVRGRGVCFIPQVISNDTLLCYDSIKVRANVTIEQGHRLTICPGTKVVLQGDYKFDVAGSLFARGSGEHKIKFFPEVPGNTWSGFSIAGQGITDSIIFDNCIIEDCQVVGNQKAGSGGAIQISSDSYVLINNSEINNCKASLNGGGIYCSGSTFYFKNSSIINCSASYGGGLYLNNVDYAEITDCIINNCIASNDGGGIFSQYVASCNILQSRISNCTASHAGGLLCKGSVNLFESEFNNCKAYADGGGVYLDGALTGSIEKCRFIQNRGQSLEGGGIYMTGSLATINNNYFRENVGGSGAGLYMQNSSPLVINNSFLDNRSSVGNGSGLGIYIVFNYENIAVNIIQNVIYSNKSNDYITGGSGIYISGARVNILMNDIVYNEVLNDYDHGGGIFCNNISWDSVRISGNIIYDNFPDQISKSDYSAPPFLDYNDIEDGWSITGTGNISADPDFYSVPADIPDSLAGYFFVTSHNSPCIDNGIIDTSGFLIPLTDFTGNPRIVNNRIDIGAYENCFRYQSFDTIFCAGQNITLKVIPSFPGPFSYAWTHNNEPVTGCDSNALVINSATISDTGYYQCIAQQESMVLKSRYIHLLIADDPDLEVITQPSGAFVVEGTDHTLVFKVGPTNNNTLYQWYFNNEPMDGENQFDLILHNFSVSMQGTYKCRAENTCGGLFSADAVLLLTPSAIEEYESSGLVVYPNPAISQLAIAPSLTPSPNWGRDGVGAVGGRQLAFIIEITDLFGRKLKEFNNISSFPYLIDITGLRDGLYILHVVNDQEETASSKFLKISE